MHTLSKTIMYFGLCGYFSSRNFYCLQLPILLKILKATIIKAYSLVVPLLHAGSLASYLPLYMKMSQVLAVDTVLEVGALS